MKKSEIEEIVELVVVLTEVVDVICIEDWFQKPVDEFDGRSPLEVIRDGDISDLWEMLYRLLSGEPSG